MGLVGEVIKLDWVLAQWTTVFQSCNRVGNMCTKVYVCAHECTWQVWQWMNECKPAKCSNHWPATETSTQLCACIHVAVLVQWTCTYHTVLNLRLALLILCVTRDRAWLAYTARVHLLCSILQCFQMPPLPFFIYLSTSRLPPTREQEGNNITHA